MKISGHRTGEAYPRTPRMAGMPPQKFVPSYGTTNADGAIGNGVSSGTWAFDGQTMTLKWAFTLGTTTTVGTGEVELPLPTGWTAAMIDTAAMPDFAAFNVEQWAGATKNSATPLGISVHVATFGGNNAYLPGLRAALAAGVPGDIFHISVEVPFSRSP